MAVYKQPDPGDVALGHTWEAATDGYMRNGPAVSPPYIWKGGGGHIRS